MVSPCAPYVSDRIGRIETVTTAGRPTGAARYHGKAIYDVDVESLLIWNQTTSNWDILNEPPQTWASVTITQSVTVAGTINEGWYRRDRGTFQSYLQWTSSAAGTAANDITVALPLTLADADQVWGGFSFYDASGTYYAGAVLPSTTTAVKLVTTGGTNELGTNPAFTIASTDVLRIWIKGRY